MLQGFRLELVLDETWYHIFPCIIRCPKRLLLFHPGNGAFIRKVFAVGGVPAQIGKGRCLTAKGQADLLPAFKIADDHPRFILPGAGIDEKWIIRGGEDTEGAVQESVMGGAEPKQRLIEPVNRPLGGQIPCCVEFNKEGIQGICTCTTC